MAQVAAYRWCISVRYQSPTYADANPAHHFVVTAQRLPESDPPAPALSAPDVVADGWYNETVAFLGLCATPGIGYWTLLHLRRASNSFLDLLTVESQDEFLATLRRHGARALKGLPRDWSATKRKIWADGRNLHSHLQSLGIRVLHAGDREFPHRLRSIPDPPEWLFCEGNVSLLQGPSVALVGTRQPTRDGELLSLYFVGILARYGIASVSGLADGIDKAVHEYSLRFGIPTIAVLGTGSLRNFPADSTLLRRQIVDQGGLVVSEYLPQQSYARETFVRRNRLQSALADIVIPVQWRAKSGTAHTVRFAHEQGRPILCPRIPDWIEPEHEELSLARELGATIVTVPGDEIDIIGHIGLSCRRRDTNAQISLW